MTEVTVTDAKGRILVVMSEKDALKEWDITEAMGRNADGMPNVCAPINGRLLHNAVVAGHVVSVDGVPMMPFSHLGDVRALVGRLGNAGLDAAGKVLNATPEVDTATAGN